MAVVDDVGAVADAQGLAHVVIGDEHADAARLEETNDALDLDHGDRVDAGEGLVEQDEARVGRERPGDLDPATLAARERGRRRVAQVVHVQVLEQFVEPSLDGGFAQGLAVVIFLQLKYRAHVVGHVEFAKDRGFLRQIAQAQARPAVDGQILDGLAVEEDRPGVRAQQADQHIERSGLACAVGAQQADHFALEDRQRNVFDDLAAPVGLLQAPGLQPAEFWGGRGAPARTQFLCRGHGRHCCPSPSWLLGRRFAGGATGAAGVPSFGTGVSIARTRPVGLSLVRLATPPSTVNTSVVLL